MIDARYDVSTKVVASRSPSPPSDVGWLFLLHLLWFNLYSRLYFLLFFIILQNKDENVLFWIECLEFERLVQLELVDPRCSRFFHSRIVNILHQHFNKNKNRYFGRAERRKRFQHVLDSLNPSLSVEPLLVSNVSKWNLLTTWECCERRTIMQKNNFATNFSRIRENTNRISITINKLPSELVRTGTFQHSHLASISLWSNHTKAFHFDEEMPSFPFWKANTV
jgi:hypothetical protein